MKNAMLNIPYIRFVLSNLKFVDLVHGFWFTVDEFSLFVAGLGKPYLCFTTCL